MGEQGRSECYSFQLKIRSASTRLTHLHSSTRRRIDFPPGVLWSCSASITYSKHIRSRRSPPIAVVQCKKYWYSTINIAQCRIQQYRERKLPATTFVERAPLRLAMDFVIAQANSFAHSQGNAQGRNASQWDNSWVDSLLHRTQVTWRQRLPLPTPSKGPKEEGNPSYSKA